MPLSVLSALARLDIGPWQEAAELAWLAGGNCDSEIGLLDCGTSLTGHRRIWTPERLLFA